MAMATTPTMTPAIPSAVSTVKCMVRNPSQQLSDYHGRGGWRMTTARTHFTFRVDTWTPDGESIVEHIASVEDYQVALATYRAACERWPGTPTGPPCADRD